VKTSVLGVYRECARDNQKQSGKKRDPKRLGRKGGETRTTKKWGKEGGGVEDMQEHGPPVDVRCREARARGTGHGSGRPKAPKKKAPGGERTEVSNGRGSSG